MQNICKRLVTCVFKNIENVAFQKPSVTFSTNVDSSLPNPEGFEEEYDEHGFRIIRSGKTKIKPISLDESMRYLVSSAYLDTYGSDPVWKNYRRNHYGQRPPKIARKSCIKEDTIVSASPCPLCRDQYLVVDYRNVNLLQQFICPYTNEILPILVTGLCQEKYFKLKVQTLKAFDYGFLELKLPYVKYNFEDYFSKHYGKSYIKSSAI